MTTQPLAPLFLGLALMGAAHSQAPLLLNRIERSWPTQPAPAVSLTVGSFVPNHDGRCAVVAIGGSLFYSFQPAAFEHFTAAGGSGIQRLATVPASDEAIGTLPVVWSGTDRLAVIRGDGLRLLQHGPNGFVDAAVGNAGDPSWMGATGLSARIMGTGAMRHRCVLGWSSAWVKLSVVDAAAGLLPVATFPAPAGTVVHDAALVDWVPGGATEVAVLLSNGIAVLDVNGLPVGWLQQPAAAGRLCSWRLGSAPALTVVSSTSTSGPWNVQTWQPSVLHPSSSCTLPSAPVGLVMTNVNDDAHADLLISHQGSERPFVPGTAAGPVCGPSLRKLLDVAPGSLPSPAAANQAPAVLDDINRDGRTDLVIASAATGEIILQLGLQTQAISALTNGGEPVEGEDGVDETQQMQLLAGLGLFRTFPSDLMPAGFSVGDLDLLGLRFTLPAAGVAGLSKARVVVYEVDAEGKVLVEAGATFTYQLNPQPGHNKLSVLVPVGAVPAGPGYRRFLIEVALTNLDGTRSLPPVHVLNIHLGKDVENGDLSVAASMTPTWAQMLFWWFKLLNASPALPVQSLETSGGTPDDGGNRFIGFSFVIISPEATADLAALLPPTPVANGAATH